MVITGKITVVKDTREREEGNGWDFEPSEYCKGTVVEKLETGDYTIDGMRDLLCIERKASVAEIAQNIVQPRFVDVLERMSQYQHRYIICEFSVNDIIKFPVGSDIPKSKWSQVKITDKFIYRRFSEYMVNYGIHVIFAGNSEQAARWAFYIMRRVYDLNYQSRSS